MAGRVAGKAPIDWDGAELLYVQGELKPDGGREFLSYAGIAQRFAASIGSVELHGREDDWPGKREEFRRALRAAIGQQCVEIGAKETALAASLGAQGASRAAAVILYLLGDDPPKGKDPKWVAPDLASIDRAAKLSLVYRNLAMGARYLSGGAPATVPPTGGAANDLPAVPEVARRAALKAMSDANQDPRGPDGASPPAGAEE